MIELKSASSALLKENDAVFILRVPQSMAPDEPIRLQIAPDKLNQPVRLKIILEPYAQVTIIEEFSHGGSFFYDQETRVGAFSSLNLIQIQNLPADAELTENREIICDKESRVNFFQAALGAKSVRSSLRQKAVGARAEMNADLIACARNTQHFDFTLNNTYARPQGRGIITARGIALDQSVLGMHGVIKIEREGGGTETYLSQAALNFSPQAKVKATPALEIDTNDVKAGHGASVSNLSDEDLHYFETRGIARDEAKAMLMQGFLKDSLAKLAAWPDLQQQLTDWIRHELS